MANCQLWSRSRPSCLVARIVNDDRPRCQTETEEIGIENPAEDKARSQVARSKGEYGRSSVFVRAAARPLVGRARVDPRPGLLGLALPDLQAVSAAVAIPVA